MDDKLIEHLKSAGGELTLTGKVLTIPAQVNDARDLIPLGDEITLLHGKVVVPGVHLRKISELYAGNRQPPSFKSGPTPDYEWFFLLIERTATDVCSCTGRIERDVEFERLYTQLRRRPDGRDSNPLFSYIQAAARLYMSIRDVSRSEFEAVISRLAISARTFAMGPTSRNYFDVVSRSTGVA